VYLELQPLDARAEPHHLLGRLYGLLKRVGLPAVQECAIHIQPAGGCQGASVSVYYCPLRRFTSPGPEALDDYPFKPAPTLKVLGPA
jgi:hypothetical protein